MEKYLIEKIRTCLQKENPKNDSLDEIIMRTTALETTNVEPKVKDYGSEHVSITDATLYEDTGVIAVFYGHYTGSGPGTSCEGKSVMAFQGNKKTDSSFMKNDGRGMRNGSICAYQKISISDFDGDQVTCQLWTSKATEPNYKIPADKSEEVEVYFSEG